MAKQIEFFFDYVSPYSYLGNTELERVAARTGAEIVYRPMFLGGVMRRPATGHPGPSSPRASTCRVIWSAGHVATVCRWR
jgi:2-hydroxychromene-2-carboxylate isomerase